MTLEPSGTPDTNALPLVDLSRYDQSGFQRGRPGWYVLLWWLVQAIAFPLSLHNFSSFRVGLLRQFGARIGKNVLIRPTARFTYPWKVTIGDQSWIGDDVVFYSLAEICVGRDCVVSQKTYLCTGSHKIDDPAFSLITAPIHIGNGAWVATDCFVGPGVTIGANAVIGARSSVYRDIPAQQVAWGNPCKPRYGRSLAESP
ncbi:MAG: colanic acid biosynthesis acetyltransferase WcaF [Spirulinaceae cyanobacterium SM2_1_0]|nr:colanic acid biosynthesis acetyltransferase WcaF [Spirulinaceae cyanobacterium SM2_1_0]